jgi:Type II secretion system (T2SS), protein G
VNITEGSDVHRDEVRSDASATFISGAFNPVERSFLRATHTPLKPLSDPDSPYPENFGRPLRAWEKWNFFNSLKVLPLDIQEFQSHIIQQQSNKSGKETGLTLENTKKIEQMTIEEGNQYALAHVPVFSEIDADTITDLGDFIRERRKKQFDSIMKSSKTILAKFLEQRNKEENDKARAKRVRPKKSGRKEGVRIEPNARNLNEVTNPALHDGDDEREIMSNAEDTSMKMLMKWAVKNNVEKEQAETALSLIELLPSNSITVSNFAQFSSDFVNYLRDTVEDFKLSMQVEPVGFLHLERVSFTPLDTLIKGELVYSLPLAPDEEVNIAHLEWSNTSREFENIVTDVKEEFSEEGVTEKNELTESTSSQEQHSSAFNTGVTASGEYGGVTFSASVGYNASDSASNSVQSSRNQSSSVTRKASSRVKKEHKMSFKVASASGVEDQTVRKIKNPFTDRPVRIDYYQLIRWWRIDLFRYGIRLTYDINIPEPGSDILGKILEMDKINRDLMKGFEFTLSPYDIIRDNYLDKAKEYNAAVDPPPKSDMEMHVPDTRVWQRYEDSVRGDSFRLDFDTTEDYYIHSAWLEMAGKGWGKVDGIDRDPDRKVVVLNHFYWDENNTRDGTGGITKWLKNFENRSGKLNLVYHLWSYSTTAWLLILYLKLKDEKYKAWQMKAWSQIRDAALTRYYEARASAQERLAQLREELGSEDALTLRKKEREEVMKGVLRWFLGPTFRPIPYSKIEDESKLYDPDTGSVKDDQIWRSVLSHGEFIKFLHHAIEWENMLYVLYPYFWSSRWELKKYLNHPDPMHKAFLKAGSARVVLTIRPGYEGAFISLLEAGIGVPNPNTPYLTIAKEMEKYAMTNYPGIPAANPVLDARPLIYPEQRKAWEDMQIIIQLLDLYYKDPANNKTYPTTRSAQDLAAVLAPYLGQLTNPPAQVPTTDPWNRDYVYKCPGTHGEYDLICYGADGQSGGEDINKDITSWAEASLIGTWYEYTPTSAMDIGFNSDY